MIKTLLISMPFRGYMAPEYVYEGEISPQCDIYSLGVLIMEIITTRERNCSKDDLAGRTFIMHVCQYNILISILRIFYISYAYYTLISVNSLDGS